MAMDTRQTNFSWDEKTDRDQLPAWATKDAPHPEDCFCKDCRENGSERPPIEEAVAFV